MAIDISTLPSDTPRVEAVINKVMRKHPTFGKAATAAYYEAVHQELAPLARELERELIRMARSNVPDKGPWRAGRTAEDSSHHFVESDDFTHDVRLYVNGDFASDDETATYAAQIAHRLNAAPTPSAIPKEATRNRAATEPGGVQCDKCGCIFIGEEWRSLCGACFPGAAPRAEQPLPTHHVVQAIDKSLLKRLCAQHGLRLADGEPGAPSAGGVGVRELTA